MFSIFGDHSQDFRQLFLGSCAHSDSSGIVLWVYSVSLSLGSESCAKILSVGGAFSIVEGLRKAGSILVHHWHVKNWTVWTLLCLHCNFWTSWALVLF